VTHFLWTQVILLLVVLGSVALGTALHRHFDRRATDDARLLDTGVGSLLAYVAGSVAFLIGLMLAFAVEQYTEASDTVREQALAVAAAFDDTWELPETSVEPVRRDIICLTRSLIEDSFTTDGGSLALTTHPNTQAWWRATIATFTVESAAHPEAMGEFEAVFDSLEELSQLEQQRLLRSFNELPGVVWFVIYLCMAALVTLQSFSLRRQPVLHTTSVVFTWLVTAGLLGALVAFAEPFSTFGAAVSSAPLEAVLERLQADFPGAVWLPCLGIDGVALAN